MFIEDAEVGMKVVPTQRTVVYSDGIPEVKPATHSIIWRRALLTDQPYLYITAIDMERNRLLCNLTEEVTGDYFQEYDVEEYDENS